MNNQVNITFQGPSYDDGAEARNQPDDASITVAGFDLDWGTLTVYTNLDDGMNHTLAQPHDYTNEDGVECGESAWRIWPEDSLLAEMPELFKMRGWVFGRVIVTAGGHAVDEKASLDRLDDAHSIAEPDTFAEHDAQHAAIDRAARLEYLRGEIQAERISQGEVLELQGLAEWIEPGDVELLEWAGVPEFPEDEPELRELYDRGCQGLADIDMGELLWRILADVQSSYKLAMEGAHVDKDAIYDIEHTVTDYLANHYGDS